MWDGEKKLPFQMIRGATLPYGVHLAEIWCLSEGKIKANISAWQLFSPQTPGISKAIRVEGKNVFDLIRQLQPLGLYLAEQNED